MRAWQPYSAPGQPERVGAGDPVRIVDLWVRAPEQSYHEPMTSISVESTRIEVFDRLAALAEPTRLRIVGLLGAETCCVCDVQDAVDVAPNLLSYHLRVLREAGLVSATRRGRWMDYRLDPDGFEVLWSQLAEAGVPLPGAPTDASTCTARTEEGR